MKRAYLFFLIIIMQIGVLFSQNNVSGTLIDSVTYEKIPFVNVGLMRANDSVFISGAASNEDGFFKVEHVPNGKYIFIVSSIGYESTKKVLDVASDLANMM